MDSDVLLVQMTGSWLMGRRLPSLDEIRKHTEDQPPIRRIVLDGMAVLQWDSLILTFLNRVTAFCNQRDIIADTERLPEGILRLLALASTVPERKEARKTGDKDGFLSLIGENAVLFWNPAGEMLDFIGEVSDDRGFRRPADRSAFCFFNYSRNLL